MEQKWEFKVSQDVVKARGDQVWLLLEDFFNLHKWFPGLPICYGIHGTNAQPGCIRYCAGFGLKQQDGDESNFSWSKERLTSIDRTQMTLTYEIVDSNIGFNSYVSMVRVIPRDNGCTVEWSISLDRVAGCDRQDLVAKYDVGLQLMLKNMEAAIAVA